MADPVLSVVKSDPLPVLSVTKSEPLPAVAPTPLAHPAPMSIANDAEEPSTLSTWFETQLRPALEQVAHPKTVNDIASLILAPTDATRGVGLAALQTLVNRAKSVPSARSVLVGALDSASAALDNSITGTVSPRAKNIGKLIGTAADALREKPATPVVAVRPAPTPAPKLNDVLVDALNDVRQGAQPTSVQLAPHVPTSAGTLPTGTTRAIASTPAPTSPVATAPAPPAPAPPPTAAAPPAPMPPAEIPAATVATYPQKFLNEVAIQARRQQVTLTNADYALAHQLVQQGQSPQAAVTALAKAKAGLAASQALAQRFGLPPDAVVEAAVKARNLRGSWEK